MVGAPRAGGSQLYLRLPRLGASWEGRGSWCGAPAASVPGQFACSVAGARLGLRSLSPPAALMSMEEEPAAENLGTREEHSPTGEGGPVLLQALQYACLPLGRQQEKSEVHRWS